jgi:endogenous inhibitor of DNA gyrase (YacG/DUF329 family)
MSAADADDRARWTRGVRCPTCRAPVTWQDNPNRPFCGLTCRLIDLGLWLDERYRVESEPPDDVS